MKQIIGTILALGTIMGVAFYSMPVKAQEPTKIETRLVIKDDMGGNVVEYMQGFAEAKKQGIGVKIDGMCASACTLVTSTDFTVDYCVTENAKFGIHHPYIMEQEGEVTQSFPKSVMAQKLWGEVFYSKYPKWLQEFIDKSGGAPDVYKGASPSDMLEVPFSEISKHEKVCS